MLVILLRPTGILSWSPVLFFIFNVFSIFLRRRRRNMSNFKYLGLFWCWSDAGQIDYGYFKLRFVPTVTALTVVFISGSVSFGTSGLAIWIRLGLQTIGDAESIFGKSNCKCRIFHTAALTWSSFDWFIIFFFFNSRPRSGQLSIRIFCIQHTICLFTCSSSSSYLFGTT